jgi:surface protein
MKSLKEHLNESFINEASIEETVKPVFQPETGDELYELVNWLIEERGNKADLNDIDTSLIDDMSDLFRHSEFNGDISKWDVSRVTNMSCMFFESKFNGDISKWNVRNVKIMDEMFMDSEFNGDISKWDVRKVKNMNMVDMFKGSPLEGNEPGWYKGK